MTGINTILDTDWDTGICAKPAIIDDALTCRRFYVRVVSTRRVTTDDDIEGIFNRQYFSPESYDAYICWILAATESDMENMVKAIKKVCARYSPTSEENILQWRGGEIKIFNNIRYEFKFVILKRKSGIMAF